MNKVIADMILSDITNESLKKFTHKLGKIINDYSEKKIKHATICEITAKLLDFQSWNHLAAEVNAEAIEITNTDKKIKFVDDFLNHIDDSETYFIDDDFDSTYPNSYVLFGVGAECNFEDESEAKLEMFDELMDYYANLTCIPKKSVGEYATAGMLSGKACADAFNAEVVESAIPEKIWEKEDDKLLQQFKKLSDSELVKIAQIVPDIGLFDAVNAFFEGNLSCIALTNADGTIESKAFNYIENKVVR